MKTVVLRKDFDYTIAFFPEIRKLVFVNEDGSRILDLFFNLEKSINEISEEFKIDKTSVKSFLVDIKKSLEIEQLSYPIPKKGFFDVPLSVEVQVSNTCNLRCKHCFQDDYTKILDYKTVDQRLSLLAANKVFMLNLVGGEIFLHKDAIKIITRACDYYDFAVNIVTNATLITGEVLNNLKKIKNKPAFLISLEGTGEVNDEIRGKGVFKKVEKVIKALKKEEFYVEISCTLSSFNYPNYKKLIEFAQKNDAPCNFNLFKPLKDSHLDLVIEPKKYFSFIKELNIMQERDIKAGMTNAAIEGFMKGINRDVCRAGISGMTVDVDGYMLPCALLCEADFYKKENLPILDKDFVKKWQGDQIFIEFRKRGLSECQACAYLFSGDICGKDPYGLIAFKEHLNSQQ